MSVEVVKKSTDIIADPSITIISTQQKEEPAVKSDFGRLRYDLVPAVPMEELVKAYTHGAENPEYGDENWRKGMSWKRIIGGLFRHVWAWIRGETWDKKSGCHHLASAAWACFVLIEYEYEKIGTDDRWRYTRRAWSHGEQT